MILFTEEKLMCSDVTSSEGRGVGGGVFRGNMIVGRYCILRGWNKLDIHIVAHSCICIKPIS